MAKSAMERRQSMTRKDAIVDMLKILNGLPPYDDGGNYCRGDGYFARSIVETYGRNGQTLKDLEREVGWDAIKERWESLRRSFLG